MFDIFQIISFKRDQKVLSKTYSFQNNTFYQDIYSFEYNIKTNHSIFCFLERAETSENFYCENEKNVIIYGSVFTNKDYESLTNKKPFKLNSKELSYLYHKYSTNVAQYLKGSFVILLYDERKLELKIITDRLNVLPLYYSFKNNIFIISSAFRMILDTGIISHNLSDVALTEQLIFDYVLGSKTIFKDIRQLEPGAIYNINGEGIEMEQYWKVEELYHEHLLNKTDSLELLRSQLYQNVNLYASDTKNILLSLTGGFDGRTNLAMLDKAPSDFLCYSYGMPGSKQIEIPKIIAEKFSINYKPIYLDDKFENEYEINALNAIEFSNGTAPIMRANYPYAYKILRDYSTTILTGLFGSEIMRPVHNLGIIINDHSERLFLSEDIEKSLCQSINELKQKKYLKDKILDNSLDYIIEEIRQDYFEKYKSYDQITRFFFFIIQEGIRKYFMQEIQIERVYVTTRFPYFDDDLISLIYETPFAGMYNGFLGKSKVKRRRGQLLYAHIIRKYRPELGQIIVDRGYSPDDLLRPFPINYYCLWRGYREAQKYIKQKGNDTFNSEKWTNSIISASMRLLDNDFAIFSSGIKTNYENNYYLNDLLKYCHMISLLNYLNSL